MAHDLGLFYSHYPNNAKVRIGGPMVHQVFQVYGVNETRWIKLECGQHARMYEALETYQVDEDVDVDCMACLVRTATREEDRELAYREEYSR